jgi:hypothetical protein
MAAAEVRPRLEAQRAVRVSDMNPLKNNTDNHSQLRSPWLVH